MAERIVRVTVPTENLPAPEVANYSHFSWSGPEVQMLLGYIDLGQADADEAEDFADSAEERFGAAQ